MMATVLSGCLLRAGGPPDQEQWIEVFEFEIQPPDMNDQAATSLVEDMIGDGEIISAEHLGWVDGPGGRIDFVNHTQIDSTLGPLPVACQSVVQEFTAATGCGGDLDDELDGDIQMSGGGGTDLWQEAEFVVSADVTQVVGTTAEGTTYTVTPRDGIGFVQWPSRRGPLDLVAYDIDGNELGRVRTN